MKLNTKNFFFLLLVLLLLLLSITFPSHFREKDDQIYCNHISIWALLWMRAMGEGANIGYLYDDGDDDDGDNETQRQDRRQCAKRKRDREKQNWWAKDKEKCGQNVFEYAYLANFVWECVSVFVCIFLSIKMVGMQTWQKSRLKLVQSTVNFVAVVRRALAHTYTQFYSDCAQLAAYSSHVPMAGHKGRQYGSIYTTCVRECVRANMSHRTINTN